MNRSHNRSANIKVTTANYMSYKCNIFSMPPFVFDIWNYWSTLKLLHILCQTACVMILLISILTHRTRQYFNVSAVKI